MPRSPALYLFTYALPYRKHPDDSLNIPFDRETCGVLNGEFDSPVIQTDPADGPNEGDAATGSSPQRPSGDPPPDDPARQSETEAEAEYYRTLVDAQSRRQEEEVKA